MNKFLNITADLKNLDTINQCLDEIYELNDIPMPLQFKVSVAVEELFANICNYAYGDKEGNVDFEVEVDCEKIKIILRDSGIPFNPLEHKDPDINASAEEREIGGLGIYMVKKEMDTFNYKYDHNQNIVTIEKSR